MPYLIKVLAHPSMSPVPQKVVEKFGEKWTQPANWVGNGAYVVKDWVINERIVLERNPQYWNNAKTVINKVTYLPISSEVTDVNRYRAGEDDMTVGWQAFLDSQGERWISRKPFTGAAYSDFTDSGLIAKK